MYLFGIEVIPATDSEIKQQRENVYTKPGPRNTVATDKPPASLDHLRDEVRRINDLGKDQ
jgi:hypothetical protein